MFSAGGLNNLDFKKTEREAISPDKILRAPKVLFPVVDFWCFTKKACSIYFIID
jgi:hypothetical protein